MVDPDGVASSPYDEDGTPRRLPLRRRGRYNRSAMIMTFFYGALAVLVLIGGYVYRARRGRRGGEAGFLTDDMIRRIEEEGRLELEFSEPLDLDEIREAEEQFWSESWDEPDEYQDSPR